VSFPNVFSDFWSFLGWAYPSFDCLRAQLEVPVEQVGPVPAFFDVRQLSFGQIGVG
jgi:hypothetical protein